MNHNKSAFYESTHYDQYVMVQLSIANEIGLPEASLCRIIHDYCKFNQHNQNQRYFHDGYYWTVISAPELSKNYPFLKSDRTITRIIRDLESKGILISGFFSKIKTDRRKWLRVNTQKLGEIIEMAHQTKMTEHTSNPINSHHSSVSDGHSSVSDGHSSVSDDLNNRSIRSDHRDQTKEESGSNARAREANCEEKITAPEVQNPISQTHSRSSDQNGSQTFPLKRQEIPEIKDFQPRRSTAVAREIIKTYQLTWKDFGWFNDSYCKHKPSNFPPNIPAKTKYRLGILKGIYEALDCDLEAVREIFEDALKCIEATPALWKYSPGWIWKEPDRLCDLAEQHRMQVREVPTPKLQKKYQESKELDSIIAAGIDLAMGES